MADDLNAKNFEHLVREWTGRVHNLAYRMLGNRAEADDATQEVFLRLWGRIDAYDPARPFQPWIYRVATNTILNRIRGERTRARKHAESPAKGPKEPQESMEAAVERREREAVVHDGLQRIEGDARALLAMHYYGGLTQDEIAAVVDAPRSTVQSRIGKALESLREALGGSKSLAVLPGLEDAMRGTPPLPVDENLVASLLNIAAPAAGVAAAAAGTWLIGGILVTKKLIIAAAILAVLVAGGGFVAGRAIRGGTAADASGAGPTEYARLVEENRRLKDDLAAREPAAPRLLTSMPKSPAGTASEHDGATMAEPAAAEAPAAKAGGLDWSRFSKLFAANADKMAAVLAEHDGDQNLDPADEATMLAIFAEYMRVCIDARALSAHPFFDDRVLPDLSVAIFGDSLGLSAEKKKALEEAARGSLRSHKDDVDLDRAGPLETFESRERISEEVLAAAGEGLDPAARGKWKGLEPLARAMLIGSTSEVRIGIVSGAGGESVAAQVLTEWKQSYGLDDRQAEAVRPLAERYAADAGEVLRRRGLDQANAGGTDADRTAARREIVKLGVAVERAILGDLPQAQRAAAGKKPPAVVLLVPGTGVTKSTTNAGGL